MGKIKIPDELKPIEEDYTYFYKHYDLDKKETNYYYRKAWDDFMDLFVKEEFKTYISEMRDEWNEERETEGYDGVPPFVEWHEDIHDYIPNLENYMEKNKEEICQEFKDYVKEITSPHDYFEYDEEGE